MDQKVLVLKENSLMLIPRQRRNSFRFHQFYSYEELFLKVSAELAIIIIQVVCIFCKIWSYFPDVVVSFAIVIKASKEIHS